MADQKTTLKVGLEVGKPDLSATEKAFNDLTKKLQSQMDKLKLSPAATKVTGGGIESVKEKRDNDVRIGQYDSILKKVEKMIALEKELGREREKNNRQEHLANIQRSTFSQIERNSRTGIRGYQAPVFPRYPGPAGAEAGGQPSFSWPKNNSIGSDTPSALLSKLAIPAALTAAVYGAFKAAQFGEGVRRSFVEAPYRTSEIESASFNQQGAGGQRISSAFNGGAGRELIFSSEIGRALGNSTNEMRGKLQSPFAPILRPRQSFLAAFGTEAQKKQIESEIHLETSELRAKQLDAIKNGPEGKVTTEVKEKYLRDWRRNLDFQRQTGMSEGGFRDYLSKVNSAGFSDEQGMGATSAILGAGGSSRAATGNAAFALEMGKKYDLTNAGQAIGAISGQIGGAQQSKDALIAIQAEGTRIGLNRSDMREENRRFVEMAANTLNQSTATSSVGVDQVLDMVSKAMSGAFTSSQQQAGKSAYENYQSQSNTQSGPNAALRYANMRRDSVLGKLSERDRVKLSLIKENELTSDDNFIQDLASRYGINANDIVSHQKGAIKKSMALNPNVIKQSDELSQLRKNYVSNPEYLDRLEGRLKGEMSIDTSGAGLDQKALTQAARMMSGGKRGDTAPVTSTERGGNEMEKQQAEASRMANELFKSIQGDIRNTATVTEQFTKNINALITAMKGGDPSAISAAQKNLFGNQQPQDQEHAGTGGRGKAKDFWHP